MSRTPYQRVRITMAHINEQVLPLLASILRQQKLRTVLGGCTLLVGTISAVSAVHRVSPYPNVYMRGEYSGKGAPTRVQDPRIEIKFANCGSGPMFVHSLAIARNGTVLSPHDALDLGDACPDVVLSSVSERMFGTRTQPKIFRGRQEDGTVLATYRPVNPDDDDFVSKVFDAIKKEKITLDVTYAPTNWFPTWFKYLRTTRRSLPLVEG